MGDTLRTVQNLEQGFKKKGWVDKISGRVTARVATDRCNLEDRGLLNYERCTIAELETFINARRLNLPGEETYHVPDPTRVFELRNTRDRPQRSQERAKRLEVTRAKAKKAAYIKVLHDADEAVVFDRFEELPAEVRIIVFKMYHNDLSTPPRGLPPTLPELPYQSPLTLVSRDLRKEALPSFYEDSTFVLRFNVLTRAGRHTHHLARPNRVFLFDSAEDPDLLTSANLPPSALSRISRIYLRLVHRHTHRANTWGHRHVRSASVSWDIDLNGKTGPVLGKKGSLNGLVDPHWDVCCERLEPAITQVLQGVWARPKAHKLGRDDLKALLGAVHKALNPPRDA